MEKALPLDALYLDALYHIQKSGMDFLRETRSAKASEGAIARGATFLSEKITSLGLYQNTYSTVQPFCARRYEDCSRVASSINSGFTVIKSGGQDLLNGLARKVHGVFLSLRNCRCKVINNVCIVAESVASAVSYVVSSAYNGVYPVNPVDGKRHIHLIPSPLLYFLGGIRYHLNIAGTHRDLSSAETEYEKVMNRLKSSSKEFFSYDADLEYRVQLVALNELNAFACPGGFMAVNSALDKQIVEGLKSIDSAHIDLTSKCKVEVRSPSNLSVEDVRAALIAHEMTHVAANHTERKLLLRLPFEVIKALIYPVNYPNLLITPMGLEKMALKLVTKILEQKITQSMVVTLSDLCEFLVGPIFSNASINCEFEADLSSVYLLKNAGYNPMAALWLQEMFDRSRSGLNWSVFKLLHLNSTHPTTADRKKALLGAIMAMENSDEYISSENTTVLLKGPAKQKLSQLPLIQKLSPNQSEPDNEENVGLALEIFQA